MIYNDLEEPLVFKQKGFDSEFVVASKESKAFNLTNREANVFVMLREQREGSAWSPYFSVEDIEDFQTAYPSKKRVRDGEWSQPSEDNYG